jgi:hypothetical protein
VPANVLPRSSTHAPSLIGRFHGSRRSPPWARRSPHKDLSDPGRHLALVALDGVVEHALWLVAHTMEVTLPRERPNFAIVAVHAAEPL